MKPCILSTKDGKGWKRGGFDISYKSNSVLNIGHRHYSTFSFRYEFLHEDDDVYFSYCYPYGYSKLQKYLSEKEKEHRSIMSVKSIGRTIGGNSIDLIAITNQDKEEK